MGSANFSERCRRIRDGGVSPRGDVSVALKLGDQQVRLSGLSLSDLGRLQERWGGYLAATEAREPDLELRFHDSGRDGWLPRPSPGEVYRLEAIGSLVVSYNFAVWRDEPDGWTVAVRETDEEPFGRVLDNAVRYALARWTVETGGIALHAAAVLRGGRAFVLAGPSNIGKSTAVALRPDGISLGDDMVLLLRRGEEWVVPALPFDNSERIETTPPLGPHPLAGIWRIHQAAEHSVEQPPEILAIASLLSCASFAWAMPDLSGLLAESARALVRRHPFRFLHFRRDPGFWPMLD